MVLLAGCAALPQQEFLSVSYSLRGAQGEMQAVRSIDADGQVRGSHATQSGGELRRLIMEWQQSIAESRLGRKRAHELLARLEEVMPG